MPVPPPEPGIYPGKSFEEYQSWDAANRSLLDVGRELCWAKAKHLLAHPDPSTPAQALGALVHLRLLEPERFKREVKIGGPQNPKTGRTYGRDTIKWAEYAEANTGLVLMTPEEAAEVGLMVAGVMRNPDSGRLIEAPGKTEVCLVWDEPVKLGEETVVVRCKARCDKLIELPSGTVVCVEFKSAECAAPQSFSRAVYRYGYHRQAAAYIAGLHRITGKAPAYALLPVEKEAPHLSAVYELDEESLRVGRLEWRESLEGYARCVQTGEWPGYGMQTLGIPAYALAKFGDGGF